MATEPVLALLPSPLLGPRTWAPAAEALRRSGRDVFVPTPFRRVRTPSDVLDHLGAAIPEDQPVVLVPHSNAGLYVAALAAVRDVRGVVFVDAGLPSDAPTTPTAAPAFRELLLARADADGILPPWTQWWSEEDLATAFPDDGTRAAVEAQAHRVPLAYFGATIPSPPGWQDLPVGYLAFGETYAAERDGAERRGWPVEQLPGEHLHQLVDPDGVTGALLRLLRRLGPGRA